MNSSLDDAIIHSIIQRIVTLPKCGHGALNIRPPYVVKRYPAINPISCVGEKNGKIKIVSSFSAIKLCFAINVLNIKAIIWLNLAKIPLISVNSVSVYGLVR